MNNTLRDKISGYTDRELLSMLRDAQSYEPEAVAMAEEEARSRGGVETIVARIEAAKERRKKIASLSTAVGIEIGVGKSPEEIIANLRAEGMEGDDVTRFVDKKHAEHLERERLRKHTPQSVMTTIVGGVVASFVGAGYLSLLIIGRNRIFFIFVFGYVAAVCGIVYLFSGRRRSILVLFVALIAMGASGMLGLWFFAHGILAGYTPEN